MSQLEKANDNCKSATRKLNLATKKGSQKTAEIQQEYNTAFSKYEQQRDQFNLYFSKTKEKHCHFTLEILNNLVSAYTDYFKKISLYLESFELDIFRSNTQIASVLNFFLPSTPLLSFSFSISFLLPFLLPFFCMIQFPFLNFRFLTVFIQRENKSMKVNMQRKNLLQTFPPVKDPVPPCTPHKSLVAVIPLVLLQDQGQPPLY